jgi:hypothetical protein
MDRACDRGSAIREKSNRCQDPQRALFYIACVQVISLLWRFLTGRAAHAPLGT